MSLNISYYPRYWIGIGKNGNYNGELTMFKQFKTAALFILNLPLNIYA